VRCIVLLLLLSVAPAVGSQTAGQQERSALEIIDDCGDSAPEESVGLTELEEACPGLTRALDESGDLPLLSAQLREKLQPYDLTELQQIRSWYDAAPGRQSPDVGSLQPILDSLREQRGEQPKTWFDQLKEWLREMSEQRQSDSESRLSRWLREIQLSDAASMALLYGLSALVIALALGVVINELRISGVLRRRSAHDADATAQAAGSLQADASAAFDAMTAQGSAPAALRMLVSTLIRSGRLRVERSLTHRELCARAAFDDVQQRECFQRVAQLAERAVYGTGELPPDEVAPVIAAARTLNARLSESGA
jgi:hypothetical protein